MSRISSTLMTKPQLFGWPLAALVIGTACAVTPAPAPPPPPGLDSDARFRFTWVGRPLSDAVAQWGPARSSGEDRYRWYEGSWVEAECIRTLHVNSADVIAEALLEGTCPDLRTLEELGWIDVITTDDLFIQYERFYQTYRVATEPEIIALDGGAVFIEASVVGGYHRDSPDDHYIGLLLRSTGDRATASTDAGVLDIPVAQDLTAEARVLLNRDHAFSLKATETLPLRGLAPVDDYLAITLTSVRDQLRTTREFEVLLPSGAALTFSRDFVFAVRGLVLLLDDPERIRKLAEQGSSEY